MAGGVEIGEYSDQFSRWARWPCSGFMLCCYLVLLAYFKSRGGYKAVHIESVSRACLNDSAGASQGLKSPSEQGTRRDLCLQ
jgi:hypothetical protein